MKVCAISFKECWRTATGWESYGGFPLQMEAIRSIFDEMTLLIVEVAPRQGGLPLPDVEIVSMPEPQGTDLRRKLYVASHLSSYVRVMQRNIRSADVVHVPLPGDLPLVGMAVAALLNKPIIGRYCGAWLRTSETTIMNRVTKQAMRGLARGRNVMLATGMGETPPARGMEWIYASALTGRELSRMEPDLNRELSEPPRMAFVGRLSPEKGIENLLEAMEQIRSRGRAPLPRLLLIGDGLLRGSLEDDIRRRGLTESVQLTGQLGREELANQLKTVDFCVQPSLSEGLSKAWIDAMAHGLPVLASHVGAAGAFIGDRCGWLVPPGDCPALTAQLEAVLTGPVNWQELRRNCFDQVQNLTLERWAARIGALTAEKLGFSFSGTKLERRLA